MISKYQFNNTNPFIYMILISYLIIISVIITIFYYKIQNNNENFIDHFLINTKLINQNIIHKNQLLKNQTFSHLLQQLNEIERPENGVLFLIDDKQNLLITFTKQSQKVQFTKNIEMIEKKSQLTDAIILEGQNVWKNFYKHNWKKLKILQKKYPAKSQGNNKLMAAKTTKKNSLTLKKKAPAKTNRKNLESYAMNIYKAVKNKINSFLKYNDKEQFIDINNHIIYISKPLTHKTNIKGKTTLHKYHIIGALNKTKVFWQSFTAVRMILITMIASILLLLLISLWLVKKQFIEPTIYLFQHINNLGQSDYIPKGWLKFWKPWFINTTYQFGKKQEHIHLLENAIYTKDNNKKGAQLYNNAP